MLNLGPYSTKEFPNIRVYPTIIDRILEGVAVLLAIAAWVCAIWVYIHIEDKITANFSFMAAGLGTLCLLLVGISAYLPHSGVMVAQELPLTAWSTTWRSRWTVTS